MKPSKDTSPQIDRKGTQGKRSTIGLLTYGSGGPVWAGCVDAAQHYNANLIGIAGWWLEAKEDSHAQANILYDLITSETVDGLVVWSSGLATYVGKQKVEDFCTHFSGIPMVSLGMQLDHIPSVYMDVQTGVQILLKHLVEVHGYRDFAYMYGPGNHAENEIRVKTYLDTLESYGIHPKPETIIYSNQAEKFILGDTSSILKLIEQKYHFDAIITSSTNDAASAFRQLQARGIHVPEDIALANFGDDDMPAVPSLTKVTNQFYDKAFQATEMLIRLLDGQTVPDEIIVTPKLIIGRSCGCLKSPKTDFRQLNPIGFSKISPVATGSIDVWYLHQKIRLVDQIIEMVDAVVDGVVRTEIDALVESFHTNLRVSEGDKFLHQLEIVLSNCYLKRAYLERPNRDTAGTILSCWQDILSLLSREFLVFDNFEARINELIHQGRILIGEISQQHQALQERTLQEQQVTLGELNTKLSSALDVAKIMDVLESYLPQLGIQGCYLSLYEGGGTLPSRKSRLLLAIENGRRLDLPEDGLSFTSDHLIPKSIFPENKNLVLILRALNVSNLHLGHIAFEVGADGSAIVTRTLRGQISSALQSARLYAQAVDANQLKSRFLSMVSHELRTPINVIVGLSKLLLTDDQDAEDLPAIYRNDIQKIQDNAQHLEFLIRDVIDLSSGQIGQLKLTNQLLDIFEIINVVQSVGEQLTYEKGLSWQTEINEDLPPIMGDRTRIRQVILNLISNAVKFTETGGVTMRVKADADWIIIQVDDTGIGISPGEQALIFDEFHQTERTTTRGYGGLGLGLAVSRQLVELHGGQLGVSSSGIEGRGATFQITLPIFQGSELTLEDKYTTQRITILQDDHQSNPLVANYLMQRGFGVDTLIRDDLGHWVSELAQNLPAALLVNCHKGTPQAWEILKIINRKFVLKEIPILFYVLQMNRGEGTFLTIDYLSKPSVPTDFTHALEVAGIIGRRPETILLIDDEPQVLAVNSRLILEILPDCNILQADNGHAGLRLLRSTQPDLVLLDLMMPEMDGFEFVRLKNLDSDIRQIPVIILTSYTLAESDMSRLSEGVTAVLGKDLLTQAETRQRVSEVLYAVKQPGEESRWIARKAMAYINEHFAEEIPRKDLASIVGVDERHLTRTFHKEVGITPVVYQNRCRIREAKKLLELGDLSITNIAVQVGYSDPTYFSRIFRREVGLSPKEFIKQI